MGKMILKMILKKDFKKDFIIFKIIFKIFLDGRSCNHSFMISVKNAANL